MPHDRAKRAPLDMHLIEPTWVESCRTIVHRLLNKHAGGLGVGPNPALIGAIWARIGTTWPLFAQIGADRPTLAKLWPTRGQGSAFVWQRLADGWPTWADVGQMLADADNAVTNLGGIGPTLVHVLARVANMWPSLVEFYELLARRGHQMWPMLAYTWSKLGRSSAL